VNCETSPPAKLSASGAYFLKPSNIDAAVLGPDGFAAGDGAGVVGLGFGPGFAGVGVGFGAGFVDVGAGLAAVLPPLGAFAAPPLTGLVGAALGLEELDGRALDNGGRALDGAGLRDAAGAAASKNASSKSKNPISITHRLPL